MARAVTVEHILDEAARLAREETDRAAPLLAAFDADGTLWSGDIGERAFDRAAEHGVVDDEVVRGPIARFLAGYGLSIVDDGARTVERTLALVSAALIDGRFERAGKAKGLTRDETLADVYAMQAWCYAGHTRDALHAFGRTIYDDDIASTLFPHTRALFHGFAALGYALAVVTASPVFLVEPVLSAFAPTGARVLGMSTAMAGDRVAPAPGDVVYGAGKVDAITRAFACAPTFAFGDTVVGGDRELLASARIAVAVRPKGAHREAALQMDTLWLLE